MSQVGERASPYENAKDNLDKILNTTSFSDFNSATEFLLNQIPGIALIDSDYTIRKSIDAAKRFRFGEIPHESIENIRRLTSCGWQIGIVSNQRREGHQVARILGTIYNYDFFPDSLEREVGRGRVFGATGPPWEIYKKTGKSLKEVSSFIIQFGMAPLIKGGIYMVGDKKDDGIFLLKLQSYLPKGVKVKFCKLPDPPWIVGVIY